MAQRDFSLLSENPGLHQQAEEKEPRLQGPVSPPAKLRVDPQPRTKVVSIAPDENPLSPSLSKHAGPNQRFLNLSDSSIDGHLPGQASHPNQLMKGGTWKHGLYDCGDMGVCCTGMWCPCIIYGRTQYRLSQRSEKRDPTNMLGYSACNGSCAAFAILCGCNLILAAIQHSRVRRIYDIPGGIGTDLGKACCCCCCTLSQDEKEIKFRQNQARHLPEPSMRYASPTGMSFSPPPT